MYRSCDLWLTVLCFFWLCSPLEAVNSLDLNDLNVSNGVEQGLLFSVAQNKFCQMGCNLFIWSLFDRTISF